MKIKFGRLSYLLLLFISSYFSIAESIKVRILTHLKIYQVEFLAERGSYKIIGDGKDTIQLKAQESITVSKLNDSIEIRKSSGQFLGKFLWLRLCGESAENFFSIRTINPERKKRFYEDHLIIGMDKINNSLRLINWLELDKYIGGVVEAEAGRKSHPEFYKVQSILARTYALSIIGRHITEGHDLCDQVHCQAFYGRTQDNEILNNVLATKEIVVVDKDFNLINAVFHSNSGGQTANAEDVWGRPTSYLKSVKDTFSLNMPNYQWSRKMSTEDWLAYLKIKHKITVEDSITKSNALSFYQSTRRSSMDINGKKIPLKIIRSDLNLKSTYFDLRTENDSVIFSGKGYGHGIGMCQEGAMKMSKLGFSYKEIIKFYYRGIQIINKQQLAFFREN